MIHTLGLSAPVFTEPYDVENEVNGFYTYDRKILKVTVPTPRDVNKSEFAMDWDGVVTRDELVSLAGEQRCLLLAKILQV